MILETPVVHVLPYWPIAATAGAGLVAWGGLLARVSSQQKEIDKKADATQVAAVDQRLERIERNVDKLVEHLLTKAE